MPTYEVEFPEGPEAGIIVTCVDHGTHETFEPVSRRVAFHCEVCEFEMVLTRREVNEWREFTERC